MNNLKNVAVIGAGPAGLVTASELLKAGLSVTVFEQRECLGGTWAYQPINDSPDIREGNRTVFCATYPEMRVNFPRQLMGFSDYPCNNDNLQSNRVFPSHQQMCGFLTRFARRQRVAHIIRYNHQIKALHHREVSATDIWQIETERQGLLSEQYDAVLFCTGRYSEPVIPEIKGMNQFTGKIIHSVSYRGPEPFKNQRVVVLGTGPSGEDTSRQISTMANRVFVCAREGSYLFLSKMEGSYGNGRNITRQENIAYLKNNEVILQNGKILRDIDTLILSTGYQLNNSLFADVLFVSVIDEGQSLWPLYLHMFHPEHPTLGFIGLPRKTVPFTLFEYQANLAAQVFARNTQLPSTKAMSHACTQTFLRNKNPECIHELEDYGRNYHQTLAAMVHRTSPPESIFKLLDIQRAHRKKYPETYRDIPHSLLI